MEISGVGGPGGLYRVRRTGLVCGHRETGLGGIRLGKDLRAHGRGRAGKDVAKMSQRCRGRWVNLGSHASPWVNGGRFPQRSACVGSVEVRIERKTDVIARDRAVRNRSSIGPLAPPDMESHAPARHDMGSHAEQM